jgi:hypothetical protein
LFINFEKEPKNYNSNRRTEVEGRGQKRKRMKCRKIVNNKDRRKRRKEFAIDLGLTSEYFPTPGM